MAVAEAARAPRTSVRTRAVSEGTLAWMVVVTSALFIGGVYLDGWAHNHGKVDNTFFTPWHAVLYSGYGATTGVLLAAIARNRAAGLAWRRALPDGYGLSLFGALIFALAGLGDMVWHTLFGVEASTAALLSPTHLMLALGGSLMASGPLRAAWRGDSTRPRNWSPSWLAVLLSSTVLLSFLTFMTQFAHPWVWPQAGVASQVRAPGMDVYVMNADGSAQQRVTRLHGSEAADPAWSPDGRTLAMVVRDLGSKTTRLALFDTAGHERASLVSGPGDSEPILPAWSPDGQRLAYMLRADDARRGLYLVDVRGGAPTRVPSGTTLTAPLAWSPDGQRILYSADDGGSARLYSVELASGRSVPLSDGSANTVVASWSPDGKRITFGSDRDGLWQVYVMDADGRNAQRLTTASTPSGRPAASWAPAWSPDGTRIAFQSSRSSTQDIFIMAPDGSGQTNLTDNPSVDHLQPAWSPDGRQITYTARGHTQDSDIGEAYGVAAILLQAALLGGLVLLLTRRWKLPPGSLTTVLTLNAVLVSFLNDHFELIPAAVAAGIVVDVLLWRSETAGSVRARRLFAFAVPAVLYAAYFAALGAVEGIGWSVPLWSGSIVLAGVTGWLLSYLGTEPLSSSA